MDGHVRDTLSALWTIFFFFFAYPFPVTLCSSLQQRLIFKHEGLISFHFIFHHFLEIFFRGAAVDYGIALWRRCWQGKRTVALIKVTQRRLHTGYPAIHLANVDKMDELLLLNSKNSDFHHYAALCFIETWLREHILDSSLQLSGFQLFRTE